MPSSGETPTATVAVHVSWPLLGSIYGACVFSATHLVQHDGNNAMRNVNKCMATANALAAAVVFTVMSWLDDATRPQRALAYPAQMLAVLFAVLGMYVAYGMNENERRVIQHREWAGQLSGVVPAPTTPAT